jgi:hypothetical protein
MYKDAQKQWRWTYHASNGEAIAASSEAYINRADCRRGIDIMRASFDAPVWMPGNLVGAS